MELKDSSAQRVEASEACFWVSVPTLVQKEVTLMLPSFRWVSSGQPFKSELTLRGCEQILPLWQGAEMLFLLLVLCLKNLAPFKDEGRVRPDGKLQP